MAYLNEDGLETLVGKIKGQVIELTSAEYRQLPATKNSDNKLYFVNDEAYAYQIDDEPTSGSTGLVKSGGVYNWTSKIGSGTLNTTAQTIIPAVNELNAKIGSTDISSIGDGTVTGAVDELNNGLMLKSNTALVSSISANTATTVVKVENVPKGNYVVSAYVRFSASGTGGIIYARVNGSNNIIGSLYATDQYANYTAVIPVTSDNATVDITIQISTARTLLATRLNLAKV